MRATNSLGSTICTSAWVLFCSAALVSCGGSSEPGGTGGSGGAPGGAGGGGGAGGTGSATGGSGGGCPEPCGDFRSCCAGQCANTQNDPKSCGSCGVVCPTGTYCNGAGQCTQPPCTTTCSSPELCCGDQCCGSGQLCCDPQGPLSTAPVCTAPDERGTCPMGCAPLCVCASPDTPIATPWGDRPIASLAPGDLVYSVDRSSIVVVPILRVARTPVRGHRVVRVTLSSGALLEVSPGHPTADGRRFEDLRAGDRLDGVPIVAARTVPYHHDATYDILPASDSGAYYAGGVLIGSTLEGGSHVSEASERSECEGAERRSPRLESGGPTAPTSRP